MTAALATGQPGIRRAIPLSVGGDETVDEFHGTASVLLDATPSDAFALLTDVTRLPEWNAHIHHVINESGRAMVEDAEWVVQIRAMGGRWSSRSRATVVDPDGLSFEHTSRSDDGNPSYALWSWQLRPDIRGSELTVTWAVYPRSFWRRVLIARVRAPLLDREVHESLAGLNHFMHSYRQSESLAG
jgi:uncharacterized protein YndB with AHSA1/START domain